MNLYEVSYRQQEEIRSVLVEASGPVAAERRFLAEHDGADLTVLCVVRQSPGSAAPSEPGEAGG